MQDEDKIFDVAVNINQGLEPLTFTIIAYNVTTIAEQAVNFKVTRDKEILAVLRPDDEHCWHLIEGNMEPEQVAAIGAAIDGHYTWLISDAMLLTVKKLFGFSLSANDGELGKVKDVYFDDYNWGIRYLVVETGNWLLSRSVLIAPNAVTGPPNMESKTIPIALSKEQIKHSPPIDTDLPVSRQQEASLSDYYAWPAYGSVATIYPTAGMIEEASKLEHKGTEADHHDPHLRSFKHVSQYEVHNASGLVGSIEDLAIDTGNWRIKYLVLRQSTSQKREHILIPAEKIDKIDLATYRVYTALKITDMMPSSETGNYFKDTV
jgi:sporulation protein YlmC with PRC-barrel domain